MSTSHAKGPTLAPSAERWTRMHILLHWIAAGLIALQFVSGQWMSAAFHADLVPGGDGDAGGAGSVFAPLHMAIGLTVFLAVAARLWDRFSNGRPPHPPGEPTWAARLAAVTQALLYATVLSMPIAGAIAWFGGNEELGALHALASKALIALVALHAAGALANHYWFKTDVLEKMLPGRGRDADERSKADAASDRTGAAR